MIAQPRGKKTRTHNIKIDEDCDCPICLDELEVEAEISILACSEKHIMHKACLKDIKNYNETNHKPHNCPSCRVVINWDNVKEDVIINA